jgi:hypothetical protein
MPAPPVYRNPPKQIDILDISRQLWRVIIKKVLILSNLVSKKRQGNRERSRRKDGSRPLRRAHRVIALHSISDEKILLPYYTALCA